MSYRTSRAFRTRSWASARTAVAGLVAIGFCASSGAAGAQEAGPSRRGGLELRPFVGAYLPTGNQRDLLRDAFHVGAQASYRVIPQLAITGTFAWSPSKDRVTRGDQSIDIFHYDVGVEGRAASWLRGTTWDFTPFVGLGVGGRTYDYRDLDVDAVSKFAGYGALGGEFGFGRVGVRVEGRDYLSRFSPLTGRGASDTRNEITAATGLTVRF
jgi:hypothetical protein